MPLLFEIGNTHSKSAHKHVQQLTDNTDRANWLKVEREPTFADMLHAMFYEDVTSTRNTSVGGRR